ncbi:MAG: hypothetical protein ACU0GG_21430 [Paracoccaceae bacterium]
MAADKDPPYNWVDEKWKRQAGEHEADFDEFISDDVAHVLSIRTLMRVSTIFYEQLSSDREDTRRIALRILRQAFLLFCRTSKPDKVWPENLFQSYAEVATQLTDPGAFGDFALTFAGFLVSGKIHVNDPDFRTQPDYNFENRAALDAGPGPLLNAPLIEYWHVSAPV